MAMILTEEKMAELSALGQGVYGSLQDFLEPQSEKQYVAIHVDTGDFAIAKSSAAATRLLHQCHLPRRAYTRKISHEPEYGLAARLMV